MHIGSSLEVSVKCVAHWFVPGSVSEVRSALGRRRVCEGSAWQRGEVCGGCVTCGEVGVHTGRGMGDGGSRVSVVT